jgi:hypothetical protein
MKDINKYSLQLGSAFFGLLTIFILFLVYGMPYYVSPWGIPLWIEYPIRIIVLIGALYFYCWVVMGGGIKK